MHKFKKSWKALMVISGDMNRSDLFKHAYAMAYVTLFSLIPSLAAIFSLTALFRPFLGDESDLLQKARGYILEHLAAGSGEQAVSYLNSFIGNLDIKKIGITGFAGMMVTLILLIRQIEMAINRIFLVYTARNIITRFIYFWSFLTLGTFSASLSFGILSGFNLANMVGLGDQDLQSNTFIAFLVPKLCLFGFFTLIYKTVPNCFVRLSYASIGALVATVLLSLALNFYGYYTTTFTNYQAVYGALAALPVFLFWLYLLWMITLLGAVITWRTQTGFRLEEFDQKDENDLGAKERYSHQQVLVLLPYLVLLLIFNNFKTGARQNGHQIAYQYNLNPLWVGQILELLLELDLIAGVHSNTEDNGTMDRHFLPTQPAENISWQAISDSLTAEHQSWLQKNSKDWPLDIEAISQKLRTFSNDPSEKFSTVLEQAFEVQPVVTNVKTNA